jgi:L-asparagine transporter-like permease
MAYWFPGVPGAIWVLVFAVALIAANAQAVGRLGAIEYWLVMIKVVAIVLFATVALFIVFGNPGAAQANLVAHGGFMPFGPSGILLGCCFVIYSFIGVEIVGVTSGEAADPSQTIPRATRRMVLGLSAIYIVTTALLVSLTPWKELGAGESPFVSVLRRVGIPGAAQVMNFVVLSAALSSANANLYLISRTLFSLARGGYAPAGLGAITGRGAPLTALLASSLGLGAAVLVRAWWPDTAYVWFFGVALFGALFVWLMIFVTHIAFRRPAVPVGSYIGAVAIAAILVSTWWVPDLRSTLISGIPWMLVLAIGYNFGKRADRISANT